MKTSESFPKSAAVYVSPAEAVELTGLSWTILGAAIKSGELSAFRVRRRVVIRPSDLIEFVERKKVGRDQL